MLMVEMMKMCLVQLTTSMCLGDVDGGDDEDDAPPDLEDVDIPEVRERQT
jgi:hypothetical protein